MGVVLTNSITNFCEDEAGGPWNDSFALIKLIGPKNAAVWNTTTNREIACEEVFQANVDPNTGVWTSCELTCNSEISPAGSYYEIKEFIKGKCCAVSVVQFDCVNVVYPDPTQLSSVVVTAPVDEPSSLFAQHLVAASSTDVGNQIQVGSDNKAFVPPASQRLHFRLDGHNDVGPYEAQATWGDMVVTNVSFQASQPSTNIETFGIYQGNTLLHTLTPSLGFTLENVAVPDVAVDDGSFISVRPTGASANPSQNLYIVVQAVYSG